MSYEGRPTPTDFERLVQLENEFEAFKDKQFDTDWEMTKKIELLAEKIGVKIVEKPTLKELNPPTSNKETV